MPEQVLSRLPYCIGRAQRRPRTLPCRARGEDPGHRAGAADPPAQDEVDRLVETDPSLVWCETDYAGTFVSGVRRGRVLATQFHPEKSQAKGLQLYRNFLTVVGD